MDPQSISHGFNAFLDLGHELHDEVVPTIVSQLGRIEEWFQHQHQYEFYSSSILVIYEGKQKATDKECPRVRTMMIDFGHVYDSNGNRDEGYLYGLRSIIHHFQALHRTTFEGQYIPDGVREHGEGQRQTHPQALPSLS